MNKTFFSIMLAAICLTGFSHIMPFYAPQGKCTTDGRSRQLELQAKLINRKKAEIAKLTTALASVPDEKQKVLMQKQIDSLEHDIMLVTGREAEKQEEGREFLRKTQSVAGQTRKIQTLVATLLEEPTPRATVEAASAEGIKVEDGRLVSGGRIQQVKGGKPGVIKLKKDK